MSDTRRASLFLGLVALLLVSSPAAAKDKFDAPPDAIESPEIAAEFVTAAKRFIDTVPASMQAKYLFRDAERGNFHFFPIARRGVPLSSLTEGQRQLGYSLLSAA